MYCCDGAELTMPDPVDLYDNVYGDFDSPAEAAVRARAFGEDIGHANFAGLQRFLACGHRLSADRRLSRYSYLAGKAE